jgi:hypothetical protein
MLPAQARALEEVLGADAAYLLHYDRGALAPKVLPSPYGYSCCPFLTLGRKCSLHNVRVADFIPSTAPDSPDNLALKPWECSMAHHALTKKEVCEIDRTIGDAWVTG